MNRFVRIGIIIFFIVIVMVLQNFGISALLTLETLQHHKDYFLQIVHDYYWLSVLIYELCYIAIVTFLLPATALMAILGGFLFGTIPGTLYANIGATIGSIIAFLLVRITGGQLLQEKYAHQLITFNNNIKQYGSWYLLLTHLIIIIPFSVINILAGLTCVSLWTFIWTTTIGIMPSLLVFAYTGKRLATITSLYDIFSWPIIIVFMLLGIIGIISLIWVWYHKIASPNQEKYHH